MSRTARRAKVTKPIAVQIRVPRAMAPVMLSALALLVAISVTCSGVNRPFSAIRPGMYAVDDVDQAVDSLRARAQPQSGDGESHVDPRERREQRLVADARREQEAVVVEEVHPHPDRKPLRACAA